MKISSAINFDRGGLKTRISLSLIVFFVANLMYPDVFETVGYMYEVTLRMSYLTLSIGAFLLIILLAATQFKSLILRHGFDIVILGIYLPVAVVAAQISVAPYFLVYPVVSILSMAISVRLFERMRFIKQLNSSGFGNTSISRLQFYIFFPYAVVIILFFALNPSALNFNLLGTYINTYDIRADTSGEGLIGYFIGWFILLFFPLFLCKANNKLAFLAPFFAFLGALYVFQAFAVKVVFLNFFLIAIFAYVYSGRYLSHFPQFLFIFLFFCSGLLGWIIHPMIDRFFYLVGLNSIYYFDFFFTNSLRYFEGTKLDLGFSSYGLEAGYLIDKAYYQGLGTNQSAGFLPSIYSDFGVFGIIVFSFIVGLFFSLIKSIHASSRMYSYLLMVAFAFALMNHPINMLFLSNGLIFILFFVLILRRKSSRTSVHSSLLN